MEPRTLLAIVSWALDTSGNWNEPSHWVDDQGIHRVPGPGDDVIIDRSPANPTVTLNAGSVAIKSLITQDPFILSGGKLDVSGTLQATSTFDFPGGTLANAEVSAGTTIKIGEVTLEGVRVKAGAVLDAATSTWFGTNIAATIVGGLTLDGILNVGRDGVSTSALIDFRDNQTLEGSGTVVFGLNPDSTSNGPVFADHAKNGILSRGSGIAGQGASATLTIGAGITIKGGSGAIRGFNPSSDSIVNLGTILGSPGGTLTIGGKDWSGSGTINGGGGTVNLVGSFTTAPLTSLTNAGGTVNLVGSLENSGATLALTPALGQWNLSGGKILGGTISGAADAQLRLTPFGGTLSAVTIATGTTVDGTRSGFLNVPAVATVAGGLTLNGTLNLGKTEGRNGGALYFPDSQTLDGTGTVVFGGGTGIGASPDVPFGGGLGLEYSFDNGLFARGTASFPGQGTPATLTIGAGIAINGGGGYLSGFNNIYDSVILTGPVVASSAGKTVIIGNGVVGQTLATDASIRAINGGAVNVAQSLQVDGPAMVAVSADSSLLVGGNLLGSTQNTSLFTPHGTVTLRGAGTPTAPDLLEVMSADRGEGPAGFVNNFAYGTLILGRNTAVKLVDQSDNSPGGGAESLYLGSLVLPTGSTLNLNGLNVYVRNAQVSGTITNGSIIQIPDSGPLALGIPTQGRISVAGELDNWTFFARGGQSITVALDPGSGAGLLPPFLGRAQLQLLDSSSRILATSNSPDNTVLTLTNIAIPADGVYTIAVRAAASQIDGTGNYLVAAYEVTHSVQSLTMNQVVTSAIVSPYSVKQWTFSAAANSQVRFDLLALSANGLTFSLTGPGGFTGFDNLADDSPLVNLPTSGTYLLTAQGAGASIGNFTFKVDQTTLTSLTLGAPYEGSLTASGQTQLFRFDIPANSPLRVVLQDANASHRNELYLKFGAPPTPTDFDVRFASPAASQDLLLPLASQGTWYALLYSDHAPAGGSFTLTATASNLFVTGVTPGQLGAAGEASLSIAGAGFRPGSTVSLTGAGGQTLIAASTQVITGSQILATFPAGTLPPGTYTVGVRLPTGDFSSLAGAFQVTAGGEAQLSTRLIVPSQVRYQSPSTIYVEYANNGTIAMPAPVLYVTATQNGRKGAILTLNPSLLTGNLSTPTLPAGFRHTVRILASGSIPGLLQPGESVRIPVYYAGWLQPWDLSYAPIDFTVSVQTADDPTPVNWSDRLGALTASELADAQQILSSLAVNLGTTWGDYVQKLNAEAQATSVGGLPPEHDVDRLEASLILHAGALPTEQPSPIAPMSTEEARPQPAAEPAIQSAPSPTVAASDLSRKGGLYVWSSDKWVPLTNNEQVNSKIATTVIIHGLSNTVDEQWIHDMGSALYQESSRTHTQMNILAIDWSDYTKQIQDLLEAVYGVLLNKVGSTFGKYYGTIYDTVLTPRHIDEVGDRVARQLFGKLSRDQDRENLIELGLEPEKTHLIGHSYGAHVAGRVGNIIQQSGHRKVSRITALDPAEESSQFFNQYGQAWGKNSASFVDSYKSSQLFGGETAWGTDNFVVIDEGDHWGSLGDPSTAHGYACEWFTNTINYVRTNRNPLKLGYLWSPTSWGNIKLDSSQDQSGAWKGIIRSSEDFERLEGLSFALNDPAKYSKPSEYPGPWAANSAKTGYFGTLFDASAINSMVFDLSSSVEFEIPCESFKAPGAWVAGASKQVQFTIEDNADIDFISNWSRLTDPRVNLYDYSYRIYLSLDNVKTPGDDDLEVVTEGFSRLAMIFSKRDSISTQLILPSAQELIAHWNERLSGNLYLIIEVNPGYKYELYPANDQVAFPIQVDLTAEVVHARTGNDERISDPGSEDEFSIFPLTVTLDGSRSGRAELIESYLWTDLSTGEVVGNKAKVTAQIRDAYPRVHSFLLQVTDLRGNTTFDDIKFFIDPLPPYGDPPEKVKVTTQPVGSMDPNEKIGPGGYGPSSFVSSNQRMAYQINFENDSNASAPAQFVTITDQLSPDLDWSTFRVTEVGWGQTLLVPPNETQRFQRTVPMTYNGETFDVLVEVGIRLATGEVYATFQSLNPLTLLPPGALIGFLPPEDGTGRGLGHIGFLISPKAGLPTGREITNVARIIFDGAEVIATNQVDEHDPSKGTDPNKMALVTIDAGAPTSTVASLSSITTAPSFTVSWSGADDPGGSGIATYNVYVSDNGGPFTLFRANTFATSATFTGLAGHTYGFVSVATDQVGNVEPTTMVAQASTTVSPASPAVSTTLVISASANPAMTGDSITFTVTVIAAAGTDAPTGSVQFSIDGTPFGPPIPLVDGVAISPNTTTLAPGNHLVTVDYVNSDGRFTGSTGTLNGGITISPPASQTGTVTTVAASNSNPIYGQTLVFTATVASASGGGVPTGTVRFLVDGVDFGSVVTLVNGTATSPSISNLASGRHVITAVYSGDAGFDPSTAPSLSSVVAKAPLIIRANDTAKTYGQANPQFTVVYNGFVLGQSESVLAGLLTFGTPATTASHVGNYTITPAGLSSNNYAIAFATGVLAITPSPLTITADDRSIVTGNGLPALTASYSGFVNGDNPDSLSRAVRLTTSATATSLAGRYPIVADSAASPDYAITFRDGILTVAPPPLVTPPPDIMSNARAVLVSTLYKEILGRSPEPKGSDFWTRRLVTGSSAPRIARSLWRSPEHRGLQRRDLQPQTTPRTAVAVAQRAYRRVLTAAKAHPAGPLNPPRARKASR